MIGVTARIDAWLIAVGYFALRLLKDIGSETHYIKWSGDFLLRLYYWEKYL